MQRMIIAVGKMGKGAASDLLAHYVKQVRPSVIVHEVADAPTSLPAALRKAKEAEAILKKLPASACMVALDAHGKPLTSEAFSDFIAAQERSGKKALCFVIGGQDGLDASVIARADMVLAFGPMIWPHKLARVMLAEQMFRAQCIASGHPYHGGHV